MKPFIVFVCTCFLTMLSPNVNATAGEREDAIERIDNALVLVRQVCIFTLDLKIENESTIIINETIGGMGTGFFIDKPQSKPNNFHILSAGHVVDCSAKWYTKRLEEIVPYGVSSLALQSASLKTEIKYKETWFPATVENLQFGGKYPDYALLLTADLPKDIVPYLIPYGIKRGEYKVGSRVVFRGFMDVGFDSEFNGASDNMMIMEDEGVIQFMEKNFFRISIKAYHGNSGSPILFWKRNKYYAIGILSAGYEFKSAIITDLDFSNINTETAPN